VAQKTDERLISRCNDYGDIRHTDIGYLSFVMPPQRMLHKRHHAFTLSVMASVPSADRPVFSPVPNIFPSPRKNRRRRSGITSAGRCLYALI